MGEVAATTAAFDQEFTKALTNILARKRAPPPEPVKKVRWFRRILDEKHNLFFDAKFMPLKEMLLDGTCRLLQYASVSVFQPGVCYRASTDIHTTAQCYFGRHISVLSYSRIANVLLAAVSVYGDIGSPSSLRLAHTCWASVSRFI